jgi:uncharacterized protein YciI
MFFLVTAHDRESALDRRIALRDSHVAYWQAQGSIVAAAGALLSGDGDDAQPTGSMIVIEANDLATVTAILARDPFTVHGVFSENIEVRRWRPALGRWCE